MKRVTMNLTLFSSDEVEVPADRPADSPPSRTKNREDNFAPENLAALQAKMLLIHERLCAEYHCPIPYFHNLDPLSELISSLLSHRTKNSDSGRAFRTLRARYGDDWAKVRDAPTHEVQEAISACTWPELKAPRIQDVLRRIGERRSGDLSLDFLGTMAANDARVWLEELPGVGPKTSAATLIFSCLRIAALPVDSHHHRVAQRLRLLPMTVEVGPSHVFLANLLPPAWDAQTVYDNHEVFMLHGQKCCIHRGPECARCVVLDLCPFGQARVSGAVASKDGLDNRTPDD